jgi:PAS domain S-box-containing protein
MNNYNQFKTKNNKEFIDKHDPYYKMIEEIEDYAIILLDKHGYIQRWNKGAEKIKLYTEEEIIGKHFSIFYLQEDVNSNLPQKLMTRAATTGKAVQEGWRKRKDGTKFWASVTITAIHDDDNNVIGFSKVTRDLTERKQADDNLKMSEERYHKMVAEVRDYAIILLDENGFIQNWNAGAQHIKGYTSEEIIGKRFSIFYPKEDRESGLPDKLLQQARDTGRAVHEGWRVRKDGSWFWGTIVITALHDQDNNLIGFSKVTRDLTEKKIADEKLLAYTTELEIQNSELEQFAYVASHDLQEPLRKIQTFAELIQQNIENRDFVNRYFEKLTASAKRMALLVKSLLNYSRLNRHKPETTEVDLNAVLENAKQNFELLIEEKHAVITNENLPTVVGDSIQLEQLFSNLISNSLKFSTQKPLIKITTETVSRDKIADLPSALHDKRFYKINFKDNGIGFEQHYDKLIFSLFQRLHGKDEYAGTGIGLALCKKIVENHGGYIKATSKPGEGAEFIIYLPVQKPSQ